MIQLRNVGKRYPTGNEALSGVTLEIGRGEMVFLSGHSGAGKSTLLKLITVIERPSRGQIVIDGQNITHLRRGCIPAFRRKIGIIFQDHRLLFDRNVFENVSLPLVIAGYGRREIGRRTRAALDKVGLLHKEKAMPVTLSGGEQQRVGIARAVINKPPVLLADEPTGNLDPELSVEIMRVFMDFSRVGVTVLVASHDIALISRMHKPIYRLHQGRLLNPDAPHEQRTPLAARV
ncbi:MAG: cell division ATP-binding protein FtsE [Gammaproteobacteria bacterium]|jgi:cell division transport system ATP-binding protein|nr:cell division ATP-binding protein FtsE [Gammaproteobacteria bacterium]